MSVEQNKMSAFRQFKKGGQLEWLIIVLENAEKLYLEREKGIFKSYKDKFLNCVKYINYLLNTTQNSEEDIIKYSILQLQSLFDAQVCKYSKPSFLESLSCHFKKFEPGRKPDEEVYNWEKVKYKLNGHRNDHHFTRILALMLKCIYAHKEQLGIMDNTKIRECFVINNFFQKNVGGIADFYKIKFPQLPVSKIQYPAKHL